jgi:protein disulfide-isomerase A1
MKKTGPPSEALACADLDATVKKNKLSLVLFGEQTTEMGKAFIATAQASDKASFYHTTADCAAANGASADGVSLFRNFDEPRIAYTGKVNDADMEAFIKANSVASLFKFSDDSVEAIFHNSSPAIVYFAEGEPHAAFEAASKTMKGKILFTYSGVSEGIQEQLGEFVGVSKEDLPCIRIIKPTESGVTKFKYEGAMNDITGESISEFVSNWEAGKLSPFRKSEAAPEDNNGPVRIIVGTAWEQEVVKSENDVLVKFYAPWCGHCTSLAPHWTALGEDVKGIKGLVIAKYDATKNEADGVEVESFPTLKLYQKGTPMDVKYNREDGK